MFIGPPKHFPLRIPTDSAQNLCLTQLHWENSDAEEMDFKFRRTYSERYDSPLKITSSRENPDIYKTYFEAVLFRTLFKVWFMEQPRCHRRVLIRMQSPGPAPEPWDQNLTPSARSPGDSGAQKV